MAEIILEKCDKMNGENEVSKENIIHEDADLNSELSDDSEIEIIIPNNVEESTSIRDKTNLMNTRELDQKCYLESLEIKDKPSSEIEIINLSSDDEETSTFEYTRLENEHEIIDCLSQDSESSYEQIEIEIETGNEKINIKQNSYGNLDELFLNSDEECVMFDFSNYSADDVLRAVENNKLLTDEGATQNLDLIITENHAKSKIEIEKSKISLTNKKKTRLNIGVKNKNVQNKIDTTKKNSNNDVQSTGRTNESADFEVNNDVMPETHLSLKCRKCGHPDSIEINVNIAARRQCPKCICNMSFQCKTCKCLFLTIFSFSNHLKNYHMKENEKILQSIDNLHLTDYTIKKRNKRQTVLKTHKVLNKQKVKKVQKVKKDEKKTTFKCVNCAEKFQSTQNLLVHRVNCHIIPYLYCRFCSLNMQSVKELREHMIKAHSLLINQSDLNQILDGIKQEGLKVMDIKSVLLVTCVICKYIRQLYHRENQCGRCRSSLLYKCGDRNCELVFSTLGELIIHVRRYHLHTWHRCNICGRAFTECADVARHRLVYHPENRVTYRHCENCHYEATSPGDMSSHIYSAHSASSAAAVQPYQGPYVCKDCGSVFKLEHRLRKHQRSFCRKTCRTYSCAHCRYTGFDKNKLLQHLRCSHVHVFTGRNFKCHRCGVLVASIYKLNSHMGKCKVKVKS